MFFNVNSQNRLAVRKALTAAGVDSAQVRLMRNGQLGQELFNLVADGKLSKAAANAACATPDDIIHDAVSATPAGIAVGQTLPADAAAALRVLLGVEAPKVDEAAMRRIAAKLVRDELAAAGQRPAVIEIRTEAGVVGRMDGKATHKVFADLVIILSTRVAGRRQHAWLAGPSGSGKSYLGHQAAQVLTPYSGAGRGIPFYNTAAIQSKYDLIGFMPINFEGQPDKCPTLMTPFRRAFQFGGVFAWDDIDASDPRAFVAFNEALANGRFAFPDAMVEQHPDFVCVASANTWGNGATADYVGRNKIDGATLTRFVRVAVDYDETLERDLVGPEYAAWCKFVQGIRAAVRKEGVKVLITPRHTLQGAALLAAGLSKDKVEAMTVFAGIDAETVERLRKAA